MILIAGHATKINGKLYEAPTHVVINVLEQILCADFTYIRYSINGSFQPQRLRFIAGQQEEQDEGWIILSPSVIRYMHEIIHTVIFAKRLQKEEKNIKFIGVDPLNAMAGFLGKKLGIFKTVVFFSVDYSTQRFENWVLNALYNFLDRFVSTHVDEVWCVSTRIHALKAKAGVSPSKNILVPNVPPSLKRIPNQKKIPHTLISLGILDTQIDYFGLLDAVNLLKKNYSDIHLTIVGNGPLEEELKQYVQENRLTNEVSILGHLAHQDALKKISESEIGVALYNGSWSFNYFGDSMKCREYLHFGLPVLTTDTHSTVEEIRDFNAGIVVEGSSNAYVKAITTLFNDYIAYSSRAKTLGKKYAGIHEKVLKRLL